MEARRQMIHISGLLFILLAQFTGRLAAAALFFMIAATFLIYSEYVRREEKRLAGFLHTVEKNIRSLAIRFERKGLSRPFLGAFWFYAGCGIAFLFYPIPIASAACAMLAVGDSLSTLAGTRFGRHRLIGSKTAEGSIALITGSLLISLLFVGPLTALIGSVAAALAELATEVGPIKSVRDRGFIDDNLVIPIIAGLAMLLA